MAGSGDKTKPWRAAGVTKAKVGRVAEALVEAGVDRLGPGSRDHLRQASLDPVLALRASAAAFEAGAPDDESRSWLWLSASLGNPRAARQLGAVLDAEAGASPAEARALRDLAHGWYARARELGGAGEAADIEEEIERDVPAEEDAPCPQPSPADGRVVVAAVGDADSKEGRDLVRRYGSAVGKPLPFRGRLPAPGELRDGILARWPWAANVADEVEAEVAVLRRAGGSCVRAPNLLLVGTRGCGKTSLARYLCRVLDLPATVVPCGGAHDAAGLAPVSRSWSTARPGAPFMAMAQGAACNPALVLDEIDKTSQAGSQNGSVSASLLSMVGEDSFHDSCLMADVDTSRLSWIATANDAGKVDENLRDRFKVVAMPSPRPQDLPVLHRNAVADFRARKGLSEADVPELGEAEMRALAAMFVKRGRSARAYYMMLESRLSKAIAAEESRLLAPERLRADAERAFLVMVSPEGAMH